MSKNELMNTTAPHEQDGWDREDDDRSAPGRKDSVLRGGSLLKWTEELGFHDRDENPIPYGIQMIALDHDVVLQRWQDGFAVTKFRDPATGKLPDENELNAAIPQTEWEINKFTDKPEPPWQRYVAIYLVDPRDGKKLGVYPDSIVLRKMACQDGHKRFL
jgi:hypothetical protein